MVRAIIDSESPEHAQHDGPTRIAMIIQRFRPAFSGQGVQVEVLSRALVRRGIDVSVITAARGHGCSVERLDGYSVVRLGVDTPSVLPVSVRQRLRGPMFAMRVLLFLATNRSYDVVHIHAQTDALYSSYAWCWLHHTPLLFEMTLMGVDDASTMLSARHRLARLRRRIFSRCDGYVAISPALEAQYREAGLPQNRLRLVPQGVDILAFTPTDEKQMLRKALDLPASGPVIIFVGSLIYRKGFDVLLRAWSAISRVRPDSHLILVGQNQFLDEARAAIFFDEQLAQLPTSAETHLHQLGVRDDISQLLQASVLFVFPSRREGFGTVMIEAMASGLPCIVAEQPGITDYIFGTDDDRGIVVPQEDHVALGAAVVEMLGNPVRAAQMGHAARDDVIRRFDIERIAERYASFYTELIDGVESLPGV